MNFDGVLGFWGFGVTTQVIFLIRRRKMEKKD